MDQPIYVVVVEQHYANHFYLDRWFPTLEEATDYVGADRDRRIYQSTPGGYFLNVRLVDTEDSNALAQAKVHKRIPDGGYTFSVWGTDGMIAGQAGKYETYDAALIAAVVHAAGMGYKEVLAKTRDGNLIKWRKNE